jgi:hypothetical protein
MIIQLKYYYHELSKWTDWFIEIVVCGFVFMMGLVAGMLIGAK